jgi:hypothetical protein
MSLKRLRWVLFALALAGLAIALHTWLPPDPRWSVRGFVGEIALTPDGSRIAVWRAESGRWQRSELRSPLTIHDADTGAVRGTFFTAEETYAAWAQSEDGRYLAALAADGTVLIADSESTTEWHADRSDPAAGQQFLRFAPDGEYLAVMDQRASIRLLHTRTGRLFRSFPATFDSRFFLPAFCHHGDFFVWEDLRGANWVGNGELRIWDMRTDKLAGVLKRATCLAISANGKTLFAAQKEGDDCNFSRIVVWDVVAGRPRCHIDTFSAGRMGMALSRDERIAALWTAWPDASSEAVDPNKGEGRGYVEFLDLCTCRQIARLEITMMGQQGVFSADGKHFLLAPLPEVILFDPSNGQERWRHARTRRDFSAWGFRFTANSSTVSWHEPGDGTVFRCAETGEVRHSLPDKTWGAAPPQGAAAPDRLLLVSSNKGQFWGPTPGPWDYVLRLWKPANVVQLPSPPPEAIRVMDTRNFEPIFALGERGVDRAMLSSDGLMLVTVHDTANGEQLLRCYDVPSPRPWRWALGIPLALGVLLPSLRAGWRRWRRRVPVAQGAAPCP